MRRGINNHVRIDAVISKPSQVYGITIDSQSQYYITDNFMVTHNCGQKNLFIIIVLPSFFLLDKYVALWRARGLFHVFSMKTRKGFWRYFNRRKKKLLFLKGKKDYTYYFVRTGFKGTFTNHYTVDEDVYRAKKARSLEEEYITSKKMGAEIRAKRWLEQRNKLLLVIVKLSKMNYSDVSGLLRKYGVKMNSDDIKQFAMGEEKELYAQSKTSSDDKKEDGKWTQIKRVGNKEVRVKT
jgi:hypothetical protein